MCHFNLKFKLFSPMYSFDSLFYSFFFTTWIMNPCAYSVLLVKIYLFYWWDILSNLIFLICVVKFASSHQHNFLCSKLLFWCLMLCLYHIYIRRALISRRSLWQRQWLLSIIFFKKIILFYFLLWWHRLTKSRKFPMTPKKRAASLLHTLTWCKPRCRSIDAHNCSCGFLLENFCLIAVKVWGRLFLLVKVVMWQCVFKL